MNDPKQIAKWYEARALGSFAMALMDLFGKADIENQLASGTLSSDEIIKASQRFGELGDIIDEKTMRWLELSEM